MLISLKHHFAFLCHKKCASNSIEAMLREHCEISVGGPPKLRHANYRQYEKYFAPYVEACIGKAGVETVCLVREPVSWLYSVYRFRSRPVLRDPDNEHHYRSTSGITFAEFVSAYMEPSPLPFADVGCQFDFVRREDGQVGVDRIFPYESIDDFVRFMSEKIGQNLCLGYTNVSPKSNRRSHVGALVNKAVRRTASRFNLKRLAPAPASPPELPDDLLAALKDYLRADIALYERAGRLYEERPLAVQPER